LGDGAGAEEGSTVGELVVGRPAAKQLFTVSAPLELTSAISMTFRAGAAAENGDEPGFDAWLLDAHRALDAGLRHDLRLLLGFSGRLLYYIEELLFTFNALAPDRLDASYDEYFAHLLALPPEEFQRLAATSVVRVYADRGVTETPPDSDDPGAWRVFLWPGITRANVDEAAALLTSPQQLKLRTLALLDGFWRQTYQAEYERWLPELQRACRFAEALAHPAVEFTFSQVTGRQLPDEVAAKLRGVERVVYCPSPNLGSFIQFVLREPDLILYFNAHSVLRDQPAPRATRRAAADTLDDDAVLDGLRALADPSRMRIVDMLREQELYAQEIVGRLGISQSAVSRHLSTLEGAHLVSVRPANGMKYYAVDRARLRSLAGHLETLAEVSATTSAN
jgi:DNA-binding transcriptional ArsR family regulator